MRIDKLTPPERKRLDAAWLDPEVTGATVMQRFRLTSDDADVVRAKLGPKARVGPAMRVDGGKPHRLLSNGWAK